MTDEEYWEAYPDERDIVKEPVVEEESNMV